MSRRRVFIALLSGWTAALSAAGAPAPPAFQSFALSVPQSNKVGFTLLSPATTGIQFTNFLSERRHLTNQILLNGSGVALGDADGDGRCDVYLCRLGGPNALYRNLGDWKFEDVTEAAGVGCAGLDSTGAAFADLDGDGDLDLIVNSIGGGTLVFFNDGKGHFSLKTKLNDHKGGTSLAVADVDGDGFLDFYVANYRTSGLMDMPNARATFKKVEGKLVVDTVDGRPVTEPDLKDRFVIGPRGSIEEQGEADALFLNERGTNFVPVSFTEGAFLDEAGRPLAKPPLDWGLAAMFRDLNGDSLPDLYVCNDFQTEDRFWINQGGGKFRLIPRLAQRKTSLFSMAVDFADLNRDGFDDFMVVDMLSRSHRQRMRDVPDAFPPVQTIGQFADRPQYSFNTVFLNRGDSTFAEVAHFAGLEASDWSWSCIFLDVDLDGWEDVLVSNGMERAARDLDVVEKLKIMRKQRQMSDTEIFQARRLFPRLDSANVAFRNRGDLRFEEVSALWGFDARGVSQGMALGDLDGDGDLDVVVNNLNGASGVYRNESSAPRVAVRLRGLAPNTRGIGAKIWVYGGPVPVQSQEIICGGRYLSSDDAMRVFAAGSPTNQMRIEVKWRNGKRSVVNEVKANRLYEIDEAGATADPSSNKPSNIQRPTSNIQRPTGGTASNPQPSSLDLRPCFEDVSHLIQHTHHEEEFNDFDRQPLLPKKLSQLGPGVAWHDLDRDGWEDLIIGSGKGGRLAVFRNNGKGSFRRLTNAGLEQVVTRDQTGVLGLGEDRILVGSANYEDGLPVGGSVREYDLAKGTLEDKLPGADWSVGPLALGDLEGDGDLDLFVGGRVIAGRYPEPAGSRVYRNEGGKWVLDQENSKTLERVGLVSAAVWSDLDGDGLPELVLACEWGPLRIFKNARGKLLPWNAPVSINHQPSTLNQLTGWWNGVTTGDFDGDGRMDIIASNWGLNCHYHRSGASRVYYGDLDGNGTVDIIEAYYDKAVEVPERNLNAMSAALPFVREKFATHAAYGQANLREIFGDKLQHAAMLEADTLATTLFLNRGDHFEAVVLPAEAQFSPAFALCVGDYDGDGNEDVFLSQNFFATQPETARLDAGRGLWLRGDGRGHLAPVPGQESGVKVYGEQRGAALCDYDGDGRIDLAVTQNGAETKLYHNVGAKPGLRVRLKGSAGNPQAVGAQLRLSFGLRQGPMREIHAGSGYWSQDSALQVMARPEFPNRIQVLWPGGKATLTPIPQGADEIMVEMNGSLHVVR